LGPLHYERSIQPDSHLFSFEAPTPVRQSRHNRTLSTYAKINFIYSVSLLLLAACENTPLKKADQLVSTTIAAESPLEREIKGLLEKGISMSERKRQVAVIEASFLRCTTPERARQLAALCFTKTLSTPFHAL